MNTFLKTIGFSGIKQQKDLEALIYRVITDAGNIEKVENKGINQSAYVEYSLMTSSSCGIKVCGEEDGEGKFHFTHYFPFLKAMFDNREEEILINKKVDSDGLTGMCEDYRLGISMIFYIQNVVGYYSRYGESKVLDDQTVSIAALAEAGKIILPTENYAKEQLKRKKESKKKSRLMTEAKKGNLEAIESLTISDIDNYAKVSMRIRNEDLLTIVDTSIVPYGSESEMYNVTGNIIAVSDETNVQTGEKIWVLQLESNEIEMDVCINAQDLLGEPKVGRRFRGNVWLQGNLRI